jgi:hypothetical protein
MADGWMETAKGRSRIAKAYWLSRQESAGIRTLVDVFGQPWRGWDVGQLFALACLDHLVTKGYATISEHYIAATPKSDKFRAANQAALRAHLDPQTTVSVDESQKGAEMDGWLSWKKAIPAHNADSSGLEVPIGGAPLEIGNTDASTTCLHLSRRGAVARWPYGHDTLYVLTTNPKDLINSVRIQRSAVNDPFIDDLAEFQNIVWSAWWGRGPARRRSSARAGASYVDEEALSESGEARSERHTAE